MRRGILGIVGSRIEDVERTACRRRPIAIEPRIDRFRRRAVGCFVTEVGRVGKRVVVHLDSGDAIVLEPRMTGLVLVADPPTREHLRFRCRCSGNGIRELLYWDRRGLGNVRLISPKEFDEAFRPGESWARCFDHDCGILSGAIGRQSAGGESGAARSAGRGRNWQFVCVGDFASGAHPSAQGDATSLREPSGSGWPMQRTRCSKQAIRYEGSTLGDGTYRNALNQAGDYQNHHRVYDRAGEACSSCGAGNRIVRIVQAQRATFFCPICQRKR